MEKMEGESKTAETRTGQKLLMLFFAVMSPMSTGAPLGYGAFSLPFYPLHVGVHGQHLELSPPKVLR